MAPIVPSPYRRIWTVPIRQTLLLCTGVVAVSFSAIFIRQAHAPAVSIALYRNAFAAAGLLPIVLLRRREELRRLSRGQVGVAALAGAILALHFALWITSLGFTSIAASVVLVTVSPIVVAFASRVLFGERISPRALAGILAGVAGAGVVSGGGFAISTRAAEGDLLAIAGAVAAAGYFVAGRHLRQDVSALTYVGVVYTVCAIVLVPVAALSHSAFTGFPLKTWGLFLLMAAVPQMLGHTVFNYLLRDVSATVVAVSILGEPIGSTLLAMAIFGEVPPWTAVAGGVLIMIGIYVAITGQARARRAGDEPVPVAVPVE
jgi:drug/metabolite transporter (DMT)-like permease